MHNYHSLVLSHEERIFVGSLRKNLTLILAAEQNIWIFQYVLGSLTKVSWKKLHNSNFYIIPAIAKIKIAQHYLFGGLVSNMLAYYESSTLWKNKLHTQTLCNKFAYDKNHRKRSRGIDRVNVLSWFKQFLPSKKKLQVQIDVSRIHFDYFRLRSFTGHNFCNKIIWTTAINNTH